MKISLNWIKEFTKIDLPIDELVAKIGAQLGAVDEVVDIGQKYQGIVIAKVVGCEKHPDADKLNVCRVDDGGVTKDVPRDVDGYIQVVCGAPNVRPGIMVAWLPPGATVPNTYGKEPFVLEARELRGQLSHGMLASPKELDLGDNHAGILELDNAVAIKPGDDFAKVYQLDDHIIEIENKMFTHRPDLFGQLGIAREIAGILGQAFKSPDWYLQRRDGVYEPAPEAGLPVGVHNELPDLVPCFVAISLSDITVQPSPVLLQTFLIRAGIRPINNVVDITNYMMLLTGQPLHAYDYDKVRALTGGHDDQPVYLTVRYPKPGEKLTLLNGKEIEPRSEAIMIAAGDKLLGVGGVMGGRDTEVDGQTKNIILECASFDMYAIRRSSMAHGLFTDAVTRFTKGQSPLQNDKVISQAVGMLRDLAGGQVRGVVDENQLADKTAVHPPVAVTTDFINARLGLELSAAAMRTLLENVEFQVETAGDELTITAPFWRTDIELREDVVEEVGRLYGYDKLPLELPRRDLTPAAKDPLFELKAAVRDRLSRAGANEVLTYSFVPGSLLDRAGQDRAQAYEIGNALSPDLQYYRLSLTPSLLEKVHANVKAGYDNFCLFEIGKAHILGEMDPAEPDVPKEVNALSFVYASKKPQAGAPYYWARKNLQELLVAFGAAGLVKLEPLAGADLYQNPWVEQMVAPFEPSRAAVLRDAAGLIWGVVGEFRAPVRRQLKLPDYTAGFEIDPLLLLQNTTPSAPEAGLAAPDVTASYTPLPRFPKVTQDITLRVPVNLTHYEIMNFFWDEYESHKLGKAATTLNLLDIYQAAAEDDHKNVTLRFTIASYDRTLTDAEINKLLDAVAAAAKVKLDAERV